MTQTPTQTLPVESFCKTCPNHIHVTQKLARVGFRLTFQLPASWYPQTGSCPTIVVPAHYHYSDSLGTEVIFLSGQDHAEQGDPPLPPHASRWWIYPGASPDAVTRVKSALSSSFRLIWQEVRP